MIIEKISASAREQGFKAATGKTPPPSLANAGIPGQPKKQPVNVDDIDAWNTSEDDIKRELAKY